MVYALFGGGFSLEGQSDVNESLYVITDKAIAMV
jgi:hypothetical protein